MEVKILPHGAFHSALIELQPGDAFLSDSGAMFRASANVDIDVTTRTKGKGGILAGVKRLLGSDTFFLSTYTVTDGKPGEVGVSPTLQGHVRRLDLDGSTAWLCAGGSWLGCDANMEMDVQFQGLKGLFSGESMFFMHVRGVGPLLVNAYGTITEVAIDGELIVDTGHVVAFEDTLSYSLTKIGGSWITSFLGGEGIVMHFRGRGKLLVQSHNPKEFGSRLGKHLPARQG